MTTLAQRISDLIALGVTVDDAIKLISDEDKTKLKEAEAKLIEAEEKTKQLTILADFSDEQRTEYISISLFNSNYCFLC